jgi:Methane oxygenase PmoA
MRSMELGATEQQIGPTPAIKLVNREDMVDFVANTGVIAGSYRFDDEFKPHFHPLRTPAGRTVSSCCPHDHKHHKGLMYALRTERVNFWEERSTLPGEQVGRIEHIKFVAQSHRDGAAAFEEELVWRSTADATEIFHEKRAVACRSHNGAFIWDWETRLQVLVDCTLITSQWSERLSDGTVVNYHGLGLRLTREFACTGGNRLLLDGQPLSFQEGMGRSPQEATFLGCFDGQWPPACASVTFRQKGRNGLYVRENPFAFLSMGPSNLSPVRLCSGSSLIEAYTVSVQDEDYAWLKSNYL